MAFEIVTPTLQQFSGLAASEDRRISNPDRGPIEAMAPSELDVQNSEFPGRPTDCATRAACTLYLIHLIYLTHTTNFDLYTR
jgi:hypothetical protein